MHHNNPFAAPSLKEELPLYPHLQQIVRVTGGTVPGPSGYMSSSVLGPSLYIGYVQQVNPNTLLLRDREPCLVLDLNRTGLIPAYYDSRLSSSHGSLPVYAVGGAPLSLPGLSASQSILLNSLTTQQFNVLNNLNPCQIQNLLTALPISQIQTLTLSLTPTQMSNFISQMTSTQITNLYNQLTTSQIRVLGDTLNSTQVQNLTTVLTPAQILTLVTNLNSTQLQTLSGLPPQSIDTIVGNLSTSQLKTFLDVTPLPGSIPTQVNAQTGTSYTFQPSDFDKLVTFSNSSPVAGTLPNPSTLGPGWYADIWNKGSGTVTLTPASGTINGAASFTVSANTGTTVYSDGTNYQVASGGAGVSSSGGVTSHEATVVATGSVQGDAALLDMSSATIASFTVTGADGTVGVILQGGIKSASVAIYNGASATLKIYPQSGAQINQLGANTVYNLLGPNSVILRAANNGSTQWQANTPTI